MKSVVLLLQFHLLSLSRSRSLAASTSEIANGQRSREICAIFDFVKSHLLIRSNVSRSIGTAKRVQCRGRNPTKGRVGLAIFSLVISSLASAGELADCSPSLGRRDRERAGQSPATQTNRARSGRRLQAYCARLRLAAELLHLVARLSESTSLISVSLLRMQKRAQLSRSARMSRKPSPRRTAQGARPSCCPADNMRTGQHAGGLSAARQSNGPAQLRRALAMDINLLVRWSRRLTRAREPAELEPEPRSETPAVCFRGGGCCCASAFIQANQCAQSDAGPLSHLGNSVRESRWQRVRL